ncbi:MAG: hypothetical protein ACK5MY_02415 [Jhaorihella sp.]
MGKNVNINYSPELTAAMFHTDPSYVRAIRGPVGAGKTVAAVMEILRLALEQEPDHNEFFYPKISGRAVRPTRFLAVRSTYPQLKATLIKTFMEWTGKLGHIVYDSPIRWHAQIPLPDNTIADVEVWFMALDGDRAEENLRSMEVTGILFSEYAEISEGIFTIAKTRTGRYPKTRKDDDDNVLFGPTRPCIFMESNSPSTRSHWYRIFEVDRPKGHRIFAQPPALIYDPTNEENPYQPNPEAENIRNLRKGYDYYYDIVNGSPKDYVDVYVMNQYGMTFSGKPVYPLFSPMLHVLGGINPGSYDTWQPERRQITIGMDLGLNPAAVLGQDGAMGNLTVYDEVHAEGILFEEFLNDMLLPVLNERFRGASVLVVADPANDVRNSLSKVNAYGMLRERGIPVSPAPSNDIPFRLESVNHFLSRRDAFHIHPRCVYLREALAGGYHFEEVRGKNGVYKDTPDKGPHSHIGNALEYFCSRFYYDVRRAAKTRRVKTSRDDNNAKKGYTYV